MCRLQLMQAEEVFAIHRQQSSLFTGREGQDLFVGPSLPGMTSFQDREHVVAEPSQFFNHGKWEVLVGIQPSHASCRFVVLNRPFDFFAMRAMIGPSVDDVFGSQRREASQQF